MAPKKRGRAAAKVDDAKTDSAQPKTKRTRGASKAASIDVKNDDGSAQQMASNVISDSQLQSQSDQNVIADVLIPVVIAAQIKDSQKAQTARLHVPLDDHSTFSSSEYCPVFASSNLI